MRKRFLDVPIVFVFLSRSTQAQQPVNSPAQGSMDPPSGQQQLLEVHAEGVQIYSCAVENGKAGCKFQGPEAKLTNSDGSLAGNHSAGPSWKLTDSSEVKGSMVASKPRPKKAQSLGCW